MAGGREACRPPDVEDISRRKGCLEHRRASSSRRCTCSERYCGNHHHRRALRPCKESAKTVVLAYARTSASNRKKEEKMKVKIFAIGFAAALAVAVPAFGGGPAIFAKAIAVGTMKPTTIQTKGGAMVLDSITIAPGGNFGWHVHGAPVAVVVTHGTLTVFDPSVAGCAPFKVPKGAS